MVALKMEDMKNGVQGDGGMGDGVVGDDVHE